MTATFPLPLKVAVLVNISPSSPYEKGIKSPFVDVFNILAPNAIGDFPDSEYKLVVLSGAQVERVFWVMSRGLEALLGC